MLRRPDGSITTLRGFTAAFEGAALHGCTRRQADALVAAPVASRFGSPALAVHFTLLYPRARVLTRHVYADALGHRSVRSGATHFVGSTVGRVVAANCAACTRKLGLTSGEHVGRIRRADASLWEAAHLRSDGTSLFAAEDGAAGSATVRTPHCPNHLPSRRLRPRRRTPRRPRPLRRFLPLRHCTLSPKRPARARLPQPASDDLLRTNDRRRAPSTSHPPMRRARARRGSDELWMRSGSAASVSACSARALVTSRPTGLSSSAW